MYGITWAAPLGAELPALSRPTHPKLELFPQLKAIEISSTGCRQELTRATAHAHPHEL